jgi:alpha-L-fucosidase 2
VKVSGDGVLRSRKAGTATIEVTSTQVSASGRPLTTKIRVRVVRSVPRVRVRGVSAAVPSSVSVGQVRYLTGTYAPSSATGVRVTYRSSDPSVAQVDAVGRLVARARGTVRITVKAGNRARSYTVRVR